MRTQTAGQQEEEQMGQAHSVSSRTACACCRSQRHETIDEPETEESQLAEEGQGAPLQEQAEQGMLHVREQARCSQEVMVEGSSEEVGSKACHTTLTRRHNDPTERNPSTLMKLHVDGLQIEGKCQKMDAKPHEEEKELQTQMQQMTYFGETLANGQQSDQEINTRKTRQ